MYVLMHKRIVLTVGAQVSACLVCILVNSAGLLLAIKNLILLCNSMVLCTIRIKSKNF